MSDSRGPRAASMPGLVGVGSGRFRPRARVGSLYARRMDEGPRRIRRVEIRTPRGWVGISWDTRQELLERLGGREGVERVVADRVRGAFEAVGTTRPVELDQRGQSLLLDVIDRWMDDVGADELPEGIFNLRYALGLRSRR